MHTVAVLAYDDVIAFDLASAVEVFRWVEDTEGQRAYDVMVAATQASVTTGPLTLGTEHDLGALRHADTVIVPGRYRPEARPDPAVLDALKSAYQAGTRIASICVGAFDLARAGLLDGRRATTHWRSAGEFASMFPAVLLDANALWVDEGQVLTSAGAAAGIDLCLHLVQNDLGAAAATAAARSAVVPLVRAGGQAQYIDHDLTPHDDRLTEVLEWMELRIAQPLTLRSIAAAANLSPRTLSRRFRDHLGTSPMSWLAMARLRVACSLLEVTDDSIEDIAARSGLGSSSNMRAVFTTHLGTSPTAYRLAFRAAH